MGRKVTLTYTAKLEDGMVFDEGLEPMTFVCGDSAMVSGFHRGIVGMRAGETRELRIAPADGFGERDPKAVARLPIGKLPAGAKPGTRLTMDKGRREATVVHVTDEFAFLDMNHPLAGKTVVFHVTLGSCEEVPRHERLVVETVKEGDRTTYPKVGDTLTMHYTGKLAASEKVFDCSRTRGDPFTFTIGIKQVIEGWDEGVMQMSLGERANLSIPAAKGYGEQGAFGVIPPHSDLVFDVELLKIDPSKAAAEP